MKNIRNEVMKKIDITYKKIRRKTKIQRQKLNLSPTSDTFDFSWEPWRLADNIKYNMKYAKYTK